MSMSLLSVPCMLQKKFIVVLVPRNAIMLYLEDDYSVLRYANQDDDVLFYIN